MEDQIKQKYLVFEYMIEASFKTGSGGAYPFMSKVFKHNMKFKLMSY